MTVVYEGIYFYLVNLFIVAKWIITILSVFYNYVEVNLKWIKMELYARGPKGRGIITRQRAKIAVQARNTIVIFILSA
jgi:hypothetical protein